MAVTYNKIPELINDMRVYREGNDDCIGVAEIQLPKFTSMTQTIDGVGVGGEVDSPIVGHYSSTECTINWRVPTKSGMIMSGGNAVALEIRGAIQLWDSSLNKYVIEPARFIIRGKAKEYDPGKLKPANTSDSSNTIEVTYYKATINNETVREVDKYAGKDIVDGVDLMADVREALGY